MLAPYRSACRSALAEYQLRHGRRPQVAEVAGRSGEVGPYREVASGVLRPMEDRVSPKDEAFAQRHSWVRRDRTQLVQLRRKRAEGERRTASSVAGLP